MENAEQIYQMARAFQGSRILLTAYELGVFDALSGQRKSSAALAKELETDSRALDRLLNALCTFDLLYKHDNQFINSPLTERHLVKGKEGYLAGLGHLNNLWDSWSSLTGAIIRDEKLKLKATEKREAQRSASFIAAMHSRAISSAPAIVAQIDLTGVKWVLDVGGGSGIFSVQFVKAGHNLKATIFDLPHVVELSRKYVAEAGVADAIDFKTGDYTETADFGSGYDLAFLCAIVHINSPRVNRELVRKCHAALNTGGRLVIQDFILDDSRTKPAPGAIFALNMLVNTPDGDSYTETEIKSWLEEAGFSGIQKLEPLGPTASIVGVKQA
jgi:2-polyprenyl-3-methyl-5-hydroxy-6-metoxy-1,4-benzoquinol methylase